MKKDKSNYKPVILAAILAGFMIFVLGLANQIFEARLWAPMSETPIDSNALEQLPMQFGDWMKAEDVPLDKDILSVIATESYINRRYSRSNSLGSICLFVGASGTTAGNLIGHDPEDCNVRAGYSFTGERFAELPLNDSMKLPCRILQFSRGSLSGRKEMTVLVYYMADGEFYGTQGQLRSRVRRGSTMVNCTAQVQIVASSAGAQSADSMEGIVSDFAVRSALSIADFIRHIPKNQNPELNGTMKESAGR